MIFLFLLISNLSYSTNWPQRVYDNIPRFSFSRENISAEWILETVFNNDSIKFSKWLERMNSRNCININSNNHEWTLLHEAALNGFYSLAENLISKKIDFNFPDNNNRTPLHIAISNGNKDIACLLLKNNAFVDSRDFNLETPLYYAIKRNSVDLVSLVINNNSKINIINIYDQSPLHVAVLQNNKHIVDLLIFKGADLHKKDCDGHTCADIALEKGNTKLAQYLTAKYNVALTGDDTFKKYLIYNPPMNVIETYLGYNTHKFPSDHDNLYYLALVNNKSDIVKTFLNCIWSKLTYFEKNLAFNWAIEFGKYDIISDLLHNKFNYEDIYQLSDMQCQKKRLLYLSKLLTTESLKKNALEMAALRGNYKLTLMLLAIGANKNGALNLYSNKSESPLYYAIKENHPHIVRLLLKHKASPFITDNNKKINVLYCKLAIDNPKINQIIEEYKHKQSDRIKYFIEKNCRCPICLELSKSEKKITTCCQQKLDLECWDRSLINQRNCPLCRSMIREPEADEIIDERFMCDLINRYLVKFRISLNDIDDLYELDEDREYDLNYIIYWLNLFINCNIYRDINVSLDIDAALQFIERTITNDNQTRAEVTSASFIKASQELFNDVRPNNDIMEDLNAVINFNNIDNMPLFRRNASGESLYIAEDMIDSHIDDNTSDDSDNNTDDTDTF